MNEKKVMFLPARPKLSKGENKEERQKLKVAAYCRVSTDSEEQAGSFETQVNHYTTYIGKNPDWILVDIYADEGISGTNTKNRREFNRMIDECLAGNIDLVITKSISRFARNTLDCLKYIRELKAKNVAVYFEKENINTLDSKGEVMITIMASLAQQESESMSKNIKLGLQYCYQQGQVKFNTTNFLGYDSDANGDLVINQKQAKIVQRIFREFLEGRGTGVIAKGLMRDQIPTGSGKLNWTGDDINRIISNEKYMGDALLQKTFTVDCLTKQRINNDGTVPQYYIENNHEAIVSKDIFNLAQQERARRSNLYSGKRKKKRLHQGKYALTGKVFCSHCGDIFRRIKWSSRGSKSIVWRCVTRLDNHTKCPARTLKEENLHQAVVDALNQVIGNKGSYLIALEENIKKVLGDVSDEKVEAIDDELHDMQKELLKAASNQESYDEVVEQIFELRKKKEMYLADSVLNQERQRRLADIKAFLKTQHTHLVDYEEKLVTRLVYKIVVRDESIDVKLKSGETISVKG